MRLERELYENLLKTVYHTGRDRARGIDADCFDELINREIKYKETSPEQDGFEDIAIEYGFALGEITTQIRIALAVYLKENEGQLSEETTGILTEYETALLNVASMKIDKASLVGEISAILKNLSEIMNF